MLPASLVVGLATTSYFTTAEALIIPHGDAVPQVTLSGASHVKAFEVATHSSFEKYQLRYTEPSICDTAVKQVSGYLDISRTKHLFFWFFEARHDPRNAPLMLWLNGGPGSSTIGSGLLFENGPCRVNSEGNDTIWNPYSWNEKVNIIYLDQPAGTGFSYLTDNSDVTNLIDLAIDVHAFLQLFMHRFPEYSKLPFHLAAESWGGHYAPHIASYVHKKNQELELAPRIGQVRINLESVILANGLTEPLSQFATIEKYLCSDGPYPPFEPMDKTCIALRAGIPACLRMIEACYNHETKLVCTSATAYCWPAILTSPLLASGKNPYDLRSDCKVINDSLCYDGLGAIGAFLNSTKTKVALGVDPGRSFQLTNETVNTAFYRTGQAMHHSAALLSELVNSGIRLMAYAGDTDGVCNYLGIELWMERLDHRFHLEFATSTPGRWRTNKTGYFAGTIRQAGDGAGNVTFVRIFEAGHLAPHDQPEASLDMIARWIDNVPLTV